MSSFNAEQQAVLQEVVEYWSNRGEDEKKLDDFTENDVMSLFSVISGHFLLQKPDVSKVETEAVKKDIFQCNDCGKWFDLMHSLERHKTLMHSGAEKGKFPCTKCDKSFLYELALKKHLMKHVELSSCNMCEKSFSSAEYLKEHKQTHHPDQKPDEEGPLSFNPFKMK